MKFLRAVRRVGGRDTDIEIPYSEDAGVGLPGTLLTATITTDPDEFWANHVFDLGPGGHVVLMRLTCLSIDPDGETFGTESGEVVAEHAATLSDVAIRSSPSGDPDDYVICAPGTFQFNSRNVSRAGADPNWDDGGLTAPGHTLAATVTSFRYLKAGVALFTGPIGDNYAGVNHPTMTVRIDVLT